MNQKAEKHLVRAEGFAERGDEFYGKAADEIIAAQEADTTLSYRQIAKRIGRSDYWVRTIVTWRTTAMPGSPIQWTRGSHATTAEIEAGVEKVLAKAPLEQIEKIVEALPAKAAAKVAQAALGKTGVSRELAASADGTAAVFRASGQVSEEVQEQNRRKSRPGKGSPRATLGFLVEVLGDLLGAKRKLRDSYTHARDHALNKDQREAIHEELDEVVLIVDWYRSYLDKGDRSFEDELGDLLSNNS